MQVRKQQLELDMEQQTCYKQEKEYIKPVYCHPAYLTFLQSIPWEMLGWKEHKLELRLLGEISTSEISITSDDTTLIVMPDVRIPEPEERRLPRQCNSQKKVSLIADSSQGSRRASNAVVWGQRALSPSCYPIYKVCISSW